MTKPKPKPTPAIKPITPEESREPQGPTLTDTFFDEVSPALTEEQKTAVLSGASHFIEGQAAIFPTGKPFSFINDGSEDPGVPSAKHKAEEEAEYQLSLGGVTAERMPTENEAPEGFIPQKYLTGEDDTADALHYTIEATNFYLFGNKMPEFYRDHNGSIHQIPETPEGKEDFLAKYTARAIEALKRQDKRDICQYCDKRRGRSCRFKHTCRAHFGIKPEA